MSNSNYGIDFKCEQKEDGSYGIKKTLELDDIDSVKTSIINLLHTKRGTFFCDNQWGTDFPVDELLNMNLSDFQIDFIFSSWENDILKDDRVDSVLFDYEFKNDKLEFQMTCYLKDGNVFEYVKTIGEL